MNSIEIQAPQSVVLTESSIQKLLKSLIRREKWQRLCFIGHQDEQNERAPWRIHLAKFLESTPIRILVLLLLLLDLLLMVLDLSSSLLSCKSPRHEEGNLLYHWGGIAILCLLTLKIVALVVALGGGFFKRPGLIVDGVVVSSALVLELVLETKGAGLVVVVSLWRVVRVVESAFELSDEAIEAQIEDIVCQFEVIRRENELLREMIVVKDKRIAELEEAVREGKHVWMRT